MNGRRPPTRTIGPDVVEAFQAMRGSFDQGGLHLLCRVTRVLAALLPSR